MVNCGACGKFMAPAGGAACSTCPLKYHKGCLSLPEKAPISRDWSCPSCKKNVRKGDNTPVKGLGDVTPPAPGDPPTHTMPERESPRRSGEKQERRDRELAVFMAEMREFRVEMAQLRESLSARLESVERRLDALEQRPPETEASGTAELERTIAELKLELNDRDQEALLSDLEVGQLPEERGVSVVQSVTVLAARLGVTLEDRDVVFAERIGQPPSEAAGRPRRVVVRLARRGLRDELLRAARVRRTVTDAAGGRVYINERLTRHNRQLFHRAREECRIGHWRYSWTKRGRIYVRQADGLPVFQIRTDADLDRVLGVRGK